MPDNFDKFLPDWTVGTLTLVAGVKTFTAANAQLTLAPIRKGDTIITPSGLTLIIESINADGNSGVLYQNTPAPAAGTFQTLIRFQSDNSRFTGQLAALVQLMSGGNLQSLAGLSSNKDLLPYFNGAGTMAATALTAFARTILGKKNRAEVNTELGLKDIATSGNAEDLNAGIIKMGRMPHLFGADGDGYIRLSNAHSDPSNGAGEGFSTIGITAAGAFYLMREGSNVVYWDLAGKQTQGEVPVQRLSGIVGNVNTAETGAIIQQGSNSNGSFIRLMDGTQICWGSVTVTPVANSVTSQDFSYPANFSATPIISSNSQTSVPVVTVQGTAIAPTGGGSTATAYVMRNNTTNTIVSWSAFGRWKN